MANATTDKIFSEQPCTSILIIHCKEKQGDIIIKKHFKAVSFILIITHPYMSFNCLTLPPSQISSPPPFLPREHLEPDPSEQPRNMDFRNYILNRSFDKNVLIQLRLFWIIGRSIPY